jgi:hypothetical protein
VVRRLDRRAQRAHRPVVKRPLRVTRGNLSRPGFRLVSRGWAEERRL